MKTVFPIEHYEEYKIVESRLIRLAPYAMALNQDPSKPLLLLKDKSGQHVLPVTLNPVEAGTALQSSSHSLIPTTPHKVTQLLLESLKMKVERCVFVEIKGHCQYVRLFIDGHPNEESLKVRADEAMSLCLHLNVPFYATRKFMNRSRTMQADLEGLAQVQSSQPDVFTRTHQYLL
ncbi:MAG: hypothetical protein COT73_04430 [Bdellovibrio sp. CG10_big_fil_rev_8_21_14_0_10_47_8]|nr:MAG: hypothetical protein COT73_04430 [Bdellovibrio sp. CG10_big_fil_rev_8_21_14_0_10_47_8]